MSSWLNGLVSIALAASISAGHASIDPERDAMIALFASYNTEEVKLAAKIVVRQEITDTEVLDLAARRLSIYFHEYSNLDPHTDTVAWLARALGVSGSTRYKPLLERASELRRRKMARGHAAKVERYLRNAIQEMVTPVNGAFESDDLPFEAWREQMLSSRSRDARNYDGYENLVPGLTIADVYEQLGQPDSIVGRIRGKRIPFYGRIDLQNLELHFRDFAAVSLHHTQGAWTVYDVVPLARDGDLRSALSSNDPDSMRQAAQAMVENRYHPEMLLDIAAERAWENMGAGDSPTVDAASWLCNLLSSSANPRYRTVLGEIRESAAHRKLRKYAARALENLDRLTVTQFEVANIPN